MFQTQGSSPRRASCTENPSNGGSEMDSSRTRQTAQESFRENARNHTSRDQYQRHRHNPRPRNLFKHVTADMPPNFFPPHISNHGRWETPENCMVPGGFHNLPRFAGPRRTDKEYIDFHSLPVLRQPPKTYEGDDGIPDKVPDDRYSIQLRNFPELPALAHERVREFGNEILACYSVQLCKFYNDSLIETAPNSFAVFTTKHRTAQRWLMVFRTDRGRVNVTYNKLLTNQVMVRCLNPVSVEVEAARNPCNTPQENCVFTFINPTEANKFVQFLHESQSILWNHREMLMEQTLRGHHPSEYYMETPNFGYYSPRPLSARSTAGYMMVSPEMPPSLTPRMKGLPPVPHQNRHKRSPFTMSARTPRADLDENWRGAADITSHHIAPDVVTPSTPGSVTQSPIRKRSKGSNKDGYSNTKSAGGDGDFVYNSLTHAMALQQTTPSTPSFKQSATPPETSTNSPVVNEVSNGRKFKASDVLVSNKRDVGTGAPDEEFFSLGPGEIQVIDNGSDQFDEIKSYTSAGQLMFSQILFGWNKVRNAEGCHNPKVRWWIGAAVIGAGGSRNGEAPRIREFKATFADEESANKFAELFQEGAIKGNNPEVRKKYLAQSLRV